MSGDAAFWAMLLVAVLATWRLTHLLAYEDGPADLVARLRSWLGAGWLGRAMDCFNCASLWVAAPIAWWLGTSAGDRVVLWLALSGAVCLLERASAEKLDIRPLNLEVTGEDHGMLRTESGGVREYGADAPTAGVAVEPTRPGLASTGILGAGSASEPRR